MKILKPKFWDKNNIGIFAIILLPITIIYQAILGLKKLSQKKKFSSCSLYWKYLYWWHG